MKKNTIKNKILSALSVAVIAVLLLAGLNSLTVPAYAAGDANTDEQVEKLLDKANYYYEMLEDYSKAIKCLKQAMPLTTSPQLKVDVLVKTAYVYFLMGKKVPRYKQYILAALKMNPSLTLPRTSYRLPFLEIFRTIRTTPQVNAKALQKRMYAKDVKRAKRGHAFFAKLNLDYVSALDKDYKEVYPSASMFPQVKAGFRLVRNVYIWGGIGVLSANGTIEEIDEPAKTSQTFFSMGMSYNWKLSPKFTCSFEGAAVSLTYKETTLGITEKGSAMGFRFDTALVYNLGKHLFSEITAGYLYATDVITEKKIMLGGFKGGFGFGVKF